MFRVQEEQSGHAPLRGATVRPVLPPDVPVEPAAGAPRQQQPLLLPAAHVRDVRAERPEEPEGVEGYVTDGAVANQGSQVIRRVRHRVLHKSSKGGYYFFFKA